MTESRINGNMLPVLCHGCNSFVIFAYDEWEMYPTPLLKGVDGLPEEIDKYYQEALRCISADSPNGAVTLFRKTIHALGIHYRITQPHDDKNLNNIIKKLKDDGHITSKIMEKLLGIKDIGNDGAHINENEPDMSQAYLLKDLMDSVLTSTIIDDQKTNTAKNLHKPNTPN